MQPRQHFWKKVVFFKYLKLQPQQHHKSYRIIKKVQQRGENTRVFGNCPFSSQTVSVFFGWSTFTYLCRAAVCVSFSHTLSIRRRQHKHLKVKVIVYRHVLPKETGTEAADRLLLQEHRSYLQLTGFHCVPHPPTAFFIFPFHFRCCCLDLVPVLSCISNLRV